MKEKICSDVILETKEVAEEQIDFRQEKTLSLCSFVNVTLTFTYANKSCQSSLYFAVFLNRFSQVTSRFKKTKLEIENFFYRKARRQSTVDEADKCINKHENIFDS